MLTSERASESFKLRPGSPCVSRSSGKNGVYGGRNYFAEMFAAWAPRSSIATWEISRWISTTRHVTNAARTNKVATQRDSGVLQITNIEKPIWKALNIVFTSRTNELKIEKRTIRVSRVHRACESLVSRWTASLWSQISATRPDIRRYVRALATAGCNDNRSRGFSAEAVKSTVKSAGTMRTRHTKRA